MKKILLFAISLCLVMTLHGCQEVILGTDKLIEKAREEIPIADAENAEITYAGQCGRGDYVLLWFVSGNAYQAHYYLPMEYKNVGENAYIFAGSYKAYDAGRDIAALQWRGGYAFLINNPDCRTLRLTDKNGTHDISIEKDAYPFTYYCEVLPSEFLFLNAEGKEIY